MIMDLRTWHGGTKNKSPYARPMIGAHYQGQHSKGRPIKKTLDRERFEQLTQLIDKNLSKEMIGKVMQHRRTSQEVENCNKVICPEVLDDLSMLSMHILHKE